MAGLIGDYIIGGGNPTTGLTQPSIKRGYTRLEVLVMLVTEVEPGDVEGPAFLRVLGNGLTMLSLYWKSLGPADGAKVLVFQNTQLDPKMLHKGKNS